MHLRKRGRKWAVVVYLGRDDTGKKRYRWYTHETRKDAEAHMAQLHHQVQVGGGVTSKSIRVRQYLERWLDDVAAGRVRETTLVGYRDIVNRHLVPAMGDIPLLRLTAPQVQGYLTAKLREGLAPATVLKHFRVLHRALADAVRYGILARNPCDYVDPPAVQRQEVRVWDEEQIRLFLAEAKRSSPYYPLYLAAVLTGMRQGELLGLRWQDVDLVLGVARVQQSLYRRGKRLWVGPTKTGRGRPVVLPPVLVEELLALRARQDEMRRVLGDQCEDHGLVFCQANGKPLHAHNIVYRDFRRVIERAGLPRIRFHDLRHCHATHLLRAGVHPKVVQERLGHSQVRVTLDTYSHVLPGLQEEAVRRLERLLWPAHGKEG
jgi:integrase